MEFINGCDNILRTAKALESLLRLRAEPVKRFPAKLLSFLSLIAYPILLLIYCERVGYIVPEPEVETSVSEEVEVKLPGFTPIPSAAEAPGSARLEVAQITREIEMELTQRRNEKLNPGGSSCAVENPIIPYRSAHVYTCPACKSEFAEEIRVYSHMFQSHSWAQAAANQLRQPTAEKKVHACHECAQKYTTWNDFIDHLFCGHRRKLLERTIMVAGDRGALDSGLTQWIQTELQKLECAPVKPKEQPQMDIPLSPIVLFFKSFKPHPVITVGPDVACPDDVF
jgi:hypothetical protein